MSSVGSVLAPGTLVSGYRVEALIGRGGMGAVYRASEQGLERKVALKVIAPELAADERFRERFLRESRIAASLDHPHVIPIYQAGDEEGLLFLAMRYVEGTDLARMVAEEGALEPRRALELLSQVAEALDAAHEKGLVHRDVKPSNVLIASAAGREHCYLGDFGLTKRTGSLSGVSVAGEIVGTLEYVAPEQITGDTLDERSDVYSLGCVLYECLTGQAPFPRATDVALLWAHVHEEPTPPSKARPELPKELDTVLARALAKEPGRRYRSAGELVAATRSALRLGDALPAPPRRARPLVVGAVAAALVAVTALAAVLLLRGDGGGLSGVSANSVGIIDASSNQLVAEVPVGRWPDGVAVDGDTAWVANSEEGSISQIDANLGRVDQTISIDGYPGEISVADGLVWVAFTQLTLDLQRGIPPTPRGNPLTLPPETFVPRLDWFPPGSSSPDGVALTGLACIYPAATAAVADSGVWFGCDSFLSRVEPGIGPAGLSFVNLAPSSDVRPDFSDVAFGLGSVWLVNRATNSVVEIDPRTLRGVREITVGREPNAIAVGSGSLWVANFEDETVSRINVPGFRQPVTVDAFAVGDGPADVVVGEEAVWVANRLGRSVMRLDPETGDVEATIDVGNQPQRLAVGGGRVWVTVRSVDGSSAP